MKKIYIDLHSQGWKHDLQNALLEWNSAFTSAREIPFIKTHNSHSINKHIIESRQFDFHKQVISKDCILCFGGFFYGLNDKRN